jgi:hypothetical protein
MGLDLEMQIVLENKQRQRQRICKCIFEAISFSFFLHTAGGWLKLHLSVTDNLGCLVLDWSRSAANNLSLATHFKKKKRERADG